MHSKSVSLLDNKNLSSSHIKSTDNKEDENDYDMHKVSKGVVSKSKVIPG